MFPGMPLCVPGVSHGKLRWLPCDVGMEGLAPVWRHARRGEASREGKAAWEMRMWGRPLIMACCQAVNWIIILLFPACPGAVGLRPVLVLEGKYWPMIQDIDHSQAL